MSKRLNNPIHRNINSIQRKQGITFVKKCCIFVSESGMKRNRKRKLRNQKKYVIIDHYPKKNNTNLKCEYFIE